jgi:hypothetical protein
MRDTTGIVACAGALSALSIRPRASAGVGRLPSYQGCDEAVGTGKRLPDDVPAVIISFVNAAERYLAASRADDVGAAVSELAPDVVMLNPATDEPLIGRELVAAALHAVDAACDEFQHTHLLAGASTGQQALFALVFEAKVGAETLRGVDLLELDEHDQICTFTVLARPMAALMALGARMSAQQG